MRASGVEVESDGAAKENVERTAAEDALNEFGGGTAVNEEGRTERTAKEDVERTADVALNELGGGAEVNEEGGRTDGTVEFLLFVVH